MEEGIFYVEKKALLEQSKGTADILTCPQFLFMDSLSFVELHADDRII
jgi:hypothetical protein